MGDAVQPHEGGELRAYLRRRRTGRAQEAVPEFEDFLKDVSLLFALRVAAEEYWAGSPRDSEFDFVEHRHLAESVRSALPLEWEAVRPILVPDEDKPRSTLITYIAAHCVEDVRVISSGLRRVLSRERVMTPVGKVQQLDSYCMRWLMRQPGRDFAEKGGVRQRVMAVVRREHVDTLENRVFKDFLIRAENLASGYLDEIQERFAAHPTYAAVKRFRMTCQSALAMPEADLISGISSLPQPNYVLQQDSRYSKIWNAYCRIVRLSRLAESLWARRASLKAKLGKLAAESLWQAEHSAELSDAAAHYHSQVWVNPLSGEMDFTERTLTHHRLADEDLRRRRAVRRRTSPIEDGIGVVDVSCARAWGSALCRGGIHPNARPRIRDDLFPLLDDEAGVHQLVKGEKLNPSDDAKRTPLASIISSLNSAEVQGEGGPAWKSAREDLQSYCSRLFGEFRECDRSLRELVVLSPDDWNPVAQECVIRSFHMLERNRVHLLWRSVATAIGLEARLAPCLRENDVVAVLDFRNDGRVLVSGLRYLHDEASGRLLPQRGSFMRNGKVNDGRYALFGRLDLNAALECTIVKGAKALCVTGDVPPTFWDFLRRAYQYADLEVGELVRTGRAVIGTNECAVLSDGEFGWAQKAGALLFRRERGKRTLYYDELESLWVVGQANEKVVSREIVAADERFSGGETRTILMPGDLLKIGEGQDAVKFFFHVGELQRSTRLHEYRETLSCGAIGASVSLSGRVEVSPGQGIAVTTIESKVFRAPLVLDYLRNMTLSKWTMDAMEQEIRRSFPPSCATVEAYAELAMGKVGYLFKLTDSPSEQIRPLIKKYLADDLKLRDVPDDAFAQAQRKKEDDLAPGESRLHLLDRWNVFGNAANAHLPWWLTEHEEKRLINKLVFNYKDKALSGKCLRLLAWMYLGPNPKVDSLVEKIVSEYESKSDTTSGLTPVQATFLANCLSENRLVGFERRVYAVICERLSNDGARKGNDLRLFYNLLQFDADIFDKLHIGLREGCGVADDLLVNVEAFRRAVEPMNYKSGLRAFLYFLRLRERERLFLRPEKMLKSAKLPVNVKWNVSSLYERAVKELSTPFCKNEADDVRMLREATLKFLQGEGTLKDVVTVSGED